MAPVDSSVSHVASSNGSPVHAAPTEVHVHSINRVAGLPVVQSALGYASGFYERVKGYNPTIGSGLSMAEQTAQLVADTAKPVIQKLEKPINYADSLVCQGLDKLEEKVPSIRKSPEELKTAGWGQYEAIKKAGTERLHNLQTYVSTKATSAAETPAGNVVLKSVDSALELAEKALDAYLPRGQDEEPEAESGGPSANGTASSNASSSSSDPATASGIVERAGRVSDKMRKRLLRTDLLLMKRALGLVTPAPQIAAASQ